MGRGRPAHIDCVSRHSVKREGQLRRLGKCADGKGDHQGAECTQQPLESASHKQASCKERGKSPEFIKLQSDCKTSIAKSQENMSQFDINSDTNVTNIQILRKYRRGAHKFLHCLFSCVIIPLHLRRENTVKERFPWREFLGKTAAIALPVALQNLLMTILHIAACCISIYLIEFIINWIYSWTIQLIDKPIERTWNRHENIK